MGSDSETTRWLLVKTLNLALVLRANEVLRYRSG